MASELKLLTKNITNGRELLKRFNIHNPRMSPLRKKQYNTIQTQISDSIGKIRSIGNTLNK